MKLVTWSASAPEISPSPQCVVHSTTPQGELQERPSSTKSLSFLSPAATSAHSLQQVESHAATATDRVGPGRLQPQTPPTVAKGSRRSGRQGAEQSGCRDPSRSQGPRGHTQPGHVGVPRALKQRAQPPIPRRDMHLRDRRGLPGGSATTYRAREVPPLAVAAQVSRGPRRPGRSAAR